MADKIKILLVDDHSLMREGMASMLREVKDFLIEGTVSSGEEAVNLAEELHPNVILMDIMMRGMTGIEAARWIKERDSKIKIILVSMEVNKDLIASGIKSGVDGYLHKDSEKEVLVEAIRTVYQGGRYFNEAITSLVFEDFYKHEKTGKPKEKKISNDLTKREHEILEIVAHGKSNKEVADTLFISIKTVETHKTHILEKLGLRNTAELVKYAIKNNIIPL
jgi:DNA-binding NarL/FixJ family response regulator